MLVIGQAALDSVLDLDRPDLDAVAAVVGGQVAHRWLELLVTISRNLTGRWRITVGSLGAPRGVDSLEILDCADAGLWAIQPCPAELIAAERLGDSGRVVSVTLTTPTTVWTWLSRLATAGSDGACGWTSGRPLPE